MGPDHGDASAWDPWQPLVDQLVGALLQGFQSIAAPVDEFSLKNLLEFAGGAEWDIALPLHRTAKAYGRAPEEMASALVETLPAIDGIESIVALGAYVNVRADAAQLADRTLRLVVGRGDRYGSSDRTLPHTCVEHTSANPTGPFHVGRVRNGVIGDTFARVLRAAGATVTTQYYVDDLGRQAAMISWIWSKPVETWPPEIREALGDAAATPDPTERADHRYGRPYPAVSAYLKTHPDAAEEVAELSRKLESGTPPPRHREITQEILGGMVASLARLGIRFDEFVWESDFLRDGSVERVVERLRSAPHAVRESNGAWAIDAAEYGLPKESAKVIVTRADGTSLYPTRDVAYHLAKFARFPRAVDVLGQDHRLHARTLDSLLAEIGETRRPEYIIYQDLTVPEGGRMSTRKGSAVWLDPLLDEATDRAAAEVRARREDLAPSEVDAIAHKVAAGAVRYHILRVAPEKTIKFRWEDALSFEGRSGPFLQYAYARASSILRKAEPAVAPYPYVAEELGHPDEVGLVRLLSRLPTTVQYVARNAHVHSLAGYGHDLAEAFNRYYQTVPVLKAKVERGSRIALVAATRQVMANTLGLLGIDPLERM